MTQNCLILFKLVVDPGQLNFLSGICVRDFILGEALIVGADKMYFIITI